MSERTHESKADVTGYYCSTCLQGCEWKGTAESGQMGDDGKILSIMYKHRCQCEDKEHNLDKIYPIVRLKEEVPLIQLLN
jgi:hypothetical protein